MSLYLSGLWLLLWKEGHNCPPPGVIFFLPLFCHGRSSHFLGASGLSRVARRSRKQGCPVPAVRLVSQTGVRPPCGCGSSGGPLPRLLAPPPPSTLSPGPRETGLLEVAGRAEITDLQRFPSRPCPRGDFCTGKGRLWPRGWVCALSGGSLAPVGAVRSRGSCLTSLSCVSLISAMGIMESAS